MTSKVRREVFEHADYFGCGLYFGATFSHAPEAYILVCLALWCLASWCDLFPEDEP